MEDNEYKKIPLADIGENVSDPAPKIQNYGCGVRHIQTFLLFFTLAIGYGARSHLGVSIVAMTIIPNVTTTNESDNLLNAVVTSEDTKNVTTSLGVDFDNSNYTINHTFDEIDTSSIYRKYMWSKPTQEMIHSSFFLGYFVAQFLMGMVAQKWGGKICLQIALSVNAVVSFATPWLVFWGDWKALCVCRVVQGLSQAGLFPSIQLLLAEWVPKKERGTLSSYVYTGSTLGTVLGFQLAGLLSDSFGWPLIFWGTGIFCSLAYALLTIFGSDTPYKHKSITEEERNFITHSVDSEPKQKPKIPWKAMWKSKHVWAIYVTHSGSGIAFLFILMQVPTYVHYTLGVDVKNSGILSSLPYCASMVTSVLFGILSDYITNRHILSVKNGRRVFNSVSQIGAAICLIAFTFTKNVGVAIFLLVTAVGCHSGIHVGWLVNYIDLAPNYAGTLISIGNSILNGLILLVPIMVSYIITDVTNQLQWRILFVLAATITIATNAIFVIFMSAEKQPWNDAQYDETDIEITKEKDKE